VEDVHVGGVELEAHVDAVVAGAGWRAGRTGVLRRARLGWTITRNLRSESVASATGTDDIMGMMRLPRVMFAVL
jgi:hypothetical protein